MLFTFSMVTNDLFELRAPEWLDDNYYPKNYVMTAICARLAAINADGTKLVPFLNDLWANIFRMASETYVQTILGGLSITVYRMPSGNYELVTYKSL